MTKYTTSDFALQQDAENNLRLHMSSNGLDCTDPIQWDGQVHRYSSRQNRKKDEWYIASEVQGKYFICTYSSWKIDEKYTYRSYEQNVFPEEKKLLEAMAEKIFVEQKEVEQERIKEVKKLWEGLDATDSHKYFDDKKLPCTNVKTRAGYVYIPMYNIDGELITLQKIDQNKEKRFYTGISTSGKMHVLGDINRDEIIIAEGFATGLSVHLANQSTVVVAFSAGNLCTVGMMLLQKYPSKKIKLAADNDKTGREYADKWKRVINSHIYFPKNKDFNDDWVSLGKESVASAFSTTIAPKSLLDILQESVSEDERLNDILFEGSVNIFYGGGGVGKSRFVTEMCFCLTLREDFAGFKFHKKAKVLLLDGEMTDWDIQSRWRELLKRYEDSPNEIQPEDFGVLSNNHFRSQFGKDINLYDEKHREIIGNMMNHYDVIIFDNFNSLSQTASEGNAAVFQQKKEWRFLFNWMRDLRNQKKTIVLIMHSTKSGENVQGVMEMRGDATSIFKMVKPFTQPTDSFGDDMLLDFVLEYDKSRNIPLHLQMPRRFSLHSSLERQKMWRGWRSNRLTSSERPAKK